MKQDATDFLATLLWTAESYDDVFKNKCARDFSAEFAAGAEAFVGAFRDYIASRGFDMSKLEGEGRRSFGDSVYLSLSGHGAGFFDDCDDDVAGLHWTLRQWAGGLRFEELDVMLSLDGNGVIDLAYKAEFLAERRRALFKVPAKEGQ